MNQDLYICGEAGMYNGHSLTISTGWLMKKVLLVTLLLVAFAVPSFSQTSKESSKSNKGEAYLHFAKARLLADSGKITDAISEYKKALELDPDNSSIYAEMADTYLPGPACHGRVGGAGGAGAEKQKS